MPHTGAKGSPWKYLFQFSDRFCHCHHVSLLQEDKMGYSNKINCYIDALRHFLLAEADSLNMEGSEKECDAEAGGMLTFLVGMNSCIGHMPMQLGNPGFYNFFERFLPAFHIGFDSERRSRIKDYAQLPSYDIYIVTEKPSDNINRVYIKPDNDDFIQRVRKLWNLQKILNKYEQSDGIISITFSADKTIRKELEKLVEELLSQSTVYYRDMCVHTGDTSDKNIEALDRLLMKAIKTLYPDNLTLNEFSEAMVKVIQACNSSQKRIALSDKDYFTDYFSTYPYCWSKQMIMMIFLNAQAEEILIPEKEDEDEEEEDDDEWG